MTYKSRYIIGLIVALLLVIGVGIFVNSSLYENYYINRKQNAMLDSYGQINKASNEGGFKSEEFDRAFNSICEKNNFNIVVLDPESQTLKSSTDDTRSMTDRLMGYIFNQPDTIDDRILDKTDKYELHLVKDPENMTEYIDMFGVLDTGNIFLMRSPIESIRESVRISSHFFNYILIGVGFLFILTFIILIRQATIRELIDNNERLQKDIEQKNEIEKMRSEFLSDVSHELKTPIALIQGYAEGLMEDVSKDKSSRDYYCEVIIDEASKMNSIVKKLLDINSIEFGDIELNYDKADITELVDNYIKSSEILCEQKGITVKKNWEGPIYVYTDEYCAYEVFNNYYTNAMNHASGEKIIEITLCIKNDKAYIFVKNTGDNIPEDALNHIWDKFYKIDKARTREYGGSGVGLSVVKAMLDSMKEEYGVNNTPDGVEFYFTLALFK